MRYLIILLFVLNSLNAWSETTQEKKSRYVKEYYEAGMKNFKEKNYEKAELYLGTVLKLKPTHGNARFHYNQAKELKTQSKAQGARNKLKSVSLAKIDIDQLNLNDALDVFRQTYKQAANEEINIIVNDSTGKMSSQTKSLSLQNLPAETALQYLVDLYGGKVVYERGLVAVRPL